MYTETRDIATYDRKLLKLSVTVEFFVVKILLEVLNINLNFSYTLGIQNCLKVFFLCIFCMLVVNHFEYTYATDFSLITDYNKA